MATALTALCTITHFSDMWIDVQSVSSSNQFFLNKREKSVNAPPRSNQQAAAQSRHINQFKAPLHFTRNLHRK